MARGNLVESFAQGVRHGLIGPFWHDDGVRELNRASGAGRKCDGFVEGLSCEDLHCVAPSAACVSARICEA